MLHIGNVLQNHILRSSNCHQISLVGICEENNHFKSSTVQYYNAKKNLYICHNMLQ